MSDARYEISYDGETWAEFTGYGNPFDAPFCRLLALPEKAPKPLTADQAMKSQIAPLIAHINYDDPPAAPSLEVPVGSRWRWNEEFVPVRGLCHVVRNSEFGINENGRGQYGNGVQSDASRDEILAHATRIDEPAGAGTQPITAANIEKHANGSLTVTLPNGSKMFFRDLEAMNNGTATDPPRPPSTPAMPPARCAPGCVPARACRITVPVTDQGTRYECPAIKEDELIEWQKKVAKTTARMRAQAELNRAEIGAPPPLTADQAEARAMRDQRWEPATPMVGRYRFNRR